MKKIKLSQNKYALVSDIDFKFLNQWKWHAAKRSNIFYAEHNTPRDNEGKQKTILMHRIILERKLGHSNFKYTDHKDGNGLNNQRRNLRPATYTENHCNQRKYKNNTSDFKGVNRHEGKWVARVEMNKKREFLGYFDDKIEAAKAYNKRAIELHGQFAKLNKIPASVIAFTGQAI
jgi:hypothetical protein